jgi:hypothetical protein
MTKLCANVAVGNSKPKADAASKSQLEDFLRRTNNAGLHAQEPDLNSKSEEKPLPSLAKPVSKSPLVEFPRLTNNAKEPNNNPKTKEEEDWELIDAAEAQDKDEWTLIGKTAAEKAELEKRIAKQDERRVKRGRKR